MIQNYKNHGRNSAPDEQTTRNSCETSKNVVLNRNLSFQSFKPNPECLKTSSLVQIAQKLSQLPENRLVDA
ncbi:hypothetical protein BYT27DRAFT_7202303 [Phlegmacium glaucopus]|nr:hypothetical protein BYT27DRAFT_7202303 [Phlegmacium glaucopus]